MSDTIRTVLVFAAIAGFVFFMVNIRKSKLVIADSIYWFVFAAIVLILGLFPEIAFFFSRTLNVASASNLVYLVIIAMLLFRIFQMDIKISQLNTKLQNLTQDTAIFRCDYENQQKEKQEAAAPAIEHPQPENTAVLLNAGAKEKEPVH